MPKKKKNEFESKEKVACERPCVAQEKYELRRTKEDIA